MSFIDNEAEMMAEHEAAKAQAKAEQEAAARAAQEVENAKYRETQRIANEKRCAELLPYYVEIAKALSDIEGFRATVVEGELQFRVVSQGYVYTNLHYYLSFETRYERSHAWRGLDKPKGVSCTVGQYGERKTFPQKKDGTFSYGKIADALVLYVRRAVSEAQTKAAKAQVADVVGDFCTKHGIREYYGNGAMKAEASSIGAEKPLFVTVEIKRAMSVADAERLAEVLYGLGLMKRGS